MYSIKISHVAYYIIEKYASMKGGITPLKLQKLLYYCKVWGLVSGELKVKAQFKAWKNGPVNGYIYHKFKKYGNQPIPIENKAGPMAAPKQEVIDFILDSYVHFAALTLSAMIHEEEPWIQTPENEVISDRFLKKYYSQQSFARNFPVESGKPYHPVYSDFMYSFVFDFQKDDEAKDITFNSFDEYNQMMHKSKQEYNDLSSLYLS